MRSVLKALAIGGLAALALIFVMRGSASASTDATCAPAAGFVPQFCVNVPTGSSARRETTVALNPISSTRTDLRVEAGIPASEILRLATTLDGAADRVETVFGRSFTARPRVLVFATPDSFARGASELFGYSAETAHQAAAAYGGIVDQATLTVAVDWRAAGSDLPGLLAHELVHVMIRDIAGSSGELPAWFEEGLATVVQREDALPSDTDALVARSLVANRVVSLEDLRTLGDWHRGFQRVGRPQYAVAAAAVRDLQERVGTAGLVQVLAEVGAGDSFAGAYGALGHGSLETFTRDFDTPTTRGRAAVSAAQSPAGDVAWTLYSFTPATAVTVRISSAHGYDLTFTVTTDALGMYRGTFGSTATPGTYALTASSGALRADATIITAR
jgi:hypothetical protein